ncbi:MAG TPA: hypothetical protein VM328_04040, partial [Fimbriimonadaceae bacterium]|nr:hypothetical protein [Fimbriimonadaceae bacterium]
PAHRKTICSRHLDLVEQGRIVLIDRFLTDDEINWGLAALDVVTILHYKRPNLSANLLKAAAVGRYVVADSFGYTGMMVERFGLGRCCDVADLSSVASTLGAAVDEAASYVQSPMVDRLIEFHSPQNFAAVALEDVCRDAGVQLVPHVRDWSWVLEQPSRLEVLEGLTSVLARDDEAAAA